MQCGVWQRGDVPSARGGRRGGQSGLPVHTADQVLLRGGGVRAGGRPAAGPGPCAASAVQWRGGLCRSALCCCRGATASTGRAGATRCAAISATSPSRRRTPHSTASGWSSSGPGQSRLLDDQVYNVAYNISARGAEVSRSWGRSPPATLCVRCARALECGAGAATAREAEPARAAPPTGECFSSPPVEAAGAHSGRKKRSPPAPACKLILSYLLSKTEALVTNNC